MEVTKKNPNRVEGRKNTYQARLLKIKEKILADTTNTSNVPSNTSNPASNVPSNTSNPTTNPTSSTKSTDVYTYSVGSLAIIVVGLCFFFTPLKARRSRRRLRINSRRKKNLLYSLNVVQRCSNYK